MIRKTGPIGWTASNEAGSRGRIARGGPREQGHEDRLVILGASLNGDGWFDSQFFEAFAGGAIGTGSVSIRMRDRSESHIAVLGQEVFAAGKSDQPYFVVQDGKLLIKKSGIKLGPIPSAGAGLGCDRWIAALPGTDAGFYCVDSLGQYWRWQGEGDEATRTIVDRRSSRRRTGRSCRLDEQLRSKDELTGRKVGTVQDRLAAMDLPASRTGELDLLSWGRHSSDGPFAFSVAVTAGARKVAVRLVLAGNGFRLSRIFGLRAIEGDEATGLCSSRRIPWFVDAEADSRVPRREAREVERFAQAPTPGKLRGEDFGSFPARRAGRCSWVINRFEGTSLGLRLIGCCRPSRWSAGRTGAVSHHRAARGRGPPAVEERRYSGRSRAAAGTSG